MAERRMFAKTIMLSDAFLDMPASARCLYFTLGMLADDDGFVNSPRSVMRQSGATVDDMNILIAKKFVLTFESGVVVIKHWRIHNLIQKDRYKQTKYLEEKNQLGMDENKAYTEAVSDGAPGCIQDVSMQEPPVGVAEDVSGDAPDTNVGRKTGRGRRFVPPAVEQVREYCRERDNSVDPERFHNYYTSNGWKVGKNTMRDLKAAVRSWEQKEKPRKKAQGGNCWLEMLEEGGYE